MKGLQIHYLAVSVSKKCKMCKIINVIKEKMAETKGYDGT
jgi:hypothetical protein